MNTSTSTPETPRYLRNLVDRAAFVLYAQWPMSAQVTFTARDADGSVLPCLARLELPSLVLHLFEHGSGEHLCQSLPGQLEVMDPDPSTWQLVEWDAPV